MDGSRDCSFGELLHEQCPIFEQLLERNLLVSLRRESLNSLQRTPVGINERLIKLARDAKELVTMLVADSRRHGNGNDSAQNRRPKRVDKMLVVREKQNQFVPGLRAMLLQRA